jgi:hypothetical protein
MNQHGVNPFTASPPPSQPQSLFVRPVSSSMKTPEFVYQARSLISSVGRGLTPCQVGIVCSIFKGRRLADLLDRPLSLRIVINSTVANRIGTRLAG